MPGDAGDSLGQAKKLTIHSSSQTYKERIGGFDPEDILRLRLRHRSAFSLQLKSRSANTDVELVQDRNQNGQIDRGEVVASSRAPDRQTDYITIAGLQAGTYFVRVLPVTDRRTAYRLTLAAPSTSETSFAYEVVQRTNRIRMERGLAPLTMNTQLTQAAERYAKRMATEDFFSHRGEDGSTWQERIRATGYNFSDAAENLAIGHSSPARVVDGWMGSPGHRANMLAYQVQEIGVGYYFLQRDRGKVVANHYWAESFGTPTEEAHSPNGLDGSEEWDVFEREFPSRHLEEFFDKLDR